MLRRMKKVVCVSQAQANKVVAAGVRPENVEVIPNSICSDRFQQPDPLYRLKLLDFFPAATRSGIRFIIGAAGRLSPEKGFDVLIDAASQRSPASAMMWALSCLEMVRCETRLPIKSSASNIARRFVLAGFTDELDRFMPHLDLFVQSSHTEGLPNVLLEALAAGVPVVATDVGGTSELLDQGRYGTLVPRGDSRQLAAAVAGLLAQPNVRPNGRPLAGNGLPSISRLTARPTLTGSLFRSMNGRVRRMMSAPTKQKPVPPDA